MDDIVIVVDDFRNKKERTDQDDQQIESKRCKHPVSFTESVLLLFFFLGHFSFSERQVRPPIPYEIVLICHYIPLSERLLFAVGFCILTYIYWKIVY